jgi:hypothetical protein
MGETFIRITCPKYTCMKDWDDDKQQLIDNIEEELNLVSSETEKAFILIEVMRRLDTEKMPPFIRKEFKQL